MGCLAVKRNGFQMLSDHTDHTRYASPFAWRYGTDEMRSVWSLEHQRRLWRRVWCALAEAQMEAGLLSPAQVADIQAHQDAIDLARAAAIEAEIHHDLMAELRAYAEQCTVGGGGLHLGATSADIQDNADALRIREALGLTVTRLDDVLAALADQIETWADEACMGFTHIQPAEPTTVGYRLAQYAHDLLADRAELVRVRDEVRGKGMKGAVGTGASYAALLDGTGWSARDLERRVMERLGIAAFPVATQTSTRKQDWRVLNGLTGIAASLHKLALDVRVLQSPGYGEWAEPFRERQVGSSAMPFKRNPIMAEKIDSLARWVAGFPRVAWDNAALSVLERTLDDSANRRVALPEAFLAVDEILHVGARLVRDLRIDRAAIARTTAVYGSFSAVEPLLMALSRAGADRQVMHERLRMLSMEAWPAAREGHTGRLRELILADAMITAVLAPARIEQLMDVQHYIGDAPQRAREMALRVQEVLHG